jgi:hypothetical protein
MVMEGMAMFRPFIRLLIAMALAAFLAACGGALELGVNGSSGGGGSGAAGSDASDVDTSQCEITALAPVKVENTRATIRWDEPDGATSYAVSVGPDWDSGNPIYISPECSAGSCSYTVPNLPINDLYTAWVLFLSDDGCSVPGAAQVDTTIKCVRYTGLPGQRLGYYIETGDVNGDGYLDAFVGNLWLLPRHTGNNIANLFLGGPNFLDSNGDLVPAMSLHGWQDWMRIGLADLNDDGFADMIASDPWYWTTFGAVGVFRGGPLIEPFLDLRHWTVYPHADFIIWRVAEIDNYFGYAFDTGDFDGDGDTDIVISAPGNPTLMNNGNVFMIPGPINSSIAMPLDDTYEIYSSFDDPGDQRGSGYFVDTIGDVSGAGYDKVLFNYDFRPLGGGNYRSYVYSYDAVNGNANFGPVDTTTFFMFAEGLPALGQDYFYVGHGSDGGAGGSALIYRYEDPLPILPLYDIADPTEVGYGMTVAAGDFDVNGGTELWIGSYLNLAKIEGPDFGSSAPESQAVKSTALKIVDFNADGYDDMLVGAFNYGTTGSFGICY